MIKVSNLNKYYNKNKDNEIHVINNCNLVLPNTGFVVFLGASGSGKTTLINVLAGLDKAKGEISYDDATFKNYKMGKIDKYRRKNIGYVFQNYNLLNNMTVYENLREVLDLIGITNEEEIDNRINYVLDILGIKKYKNRLASNLSGGQMQRVSIARALVKDSKIIIADEPTGNLDSENTIAVMNILKSLSKDRLIIMVTHDRKNASFYADRIVEIKDGVVESDYENTTTDQLDNFDKSKIYLKDLEQQTLFIGNVKVNLYLQEGEDIDDLDLTIVKKDGTIYLQNDKVKFLDKDSKIKLIDDNYKAIKKEDIESLDYNPTPFSEQKKRNVIKPMMHSLANAYRSHRASSKKMKGLHACFVIIGVVMAVCVLMLSVGTYVKSNQIEFCDIGLTFKKSDTSTYPKVAKKCVEEGYITDVTYEGSASYLSNIAGNVRLDKTIYLLDDSYINDSLVIGSKEIKNEDEIIITSRVADEIAKKMANIENISYSKLIGQKLSLSAKQATIVGIVNSESTTIYHNGLPNYVLRTTNTNTNAYYEDYKNPTMEYYQNIEYEIVSGRDVLASNECIVDINAYLYSYSSSPAIRITYNNAEVVLDVVGVYKCSDKSVVIPPNILTYEVDYPKANFKNMSGASIWAEDCELVSGVMPKEMDEILVSEWYEEGNNPYIDMMIERNNYKIVGRFKSNFSMRAACIAYSSKALLYECIKWPIRGTTFITSNEAEVLKLFNESGTQLKTSFDYEHDLRVKQKKEMFGSTITVSMIFLAIIVIYTFFMMRSKMIHRIYEIGVLREIGASRGKIYRIFFVELLVLIFMTTMIGYFASLILCHFANKKIGGLIGLFRYSPLYALGGFVVLLSVSVIAGMLPIFTLQRKTPAEIVAKYDL
ncbi:MAG: ATP-binding cassette domain-containing protein [Acholeplasmatales bacterium]|nr:ATP-binding cassette domain-containing protein [Acholeplasmatales bacterium]